MNSRWKAALTSAGLTLLFLIIYPFCNWITSLRPHVGSLYFDWERSIPFVPVFIIPYMSIYFFFLAAPFRIGSDPERATFARRMAAAMLIAAACFLLIPLRFAFKTPDVHGFLGVTFNHFRAMDRPFNEFPSLHVAFCIIIAQVYWRISHGIVRWALVMTFSLIVVSTLLTYQHHFVDLVGGIGLAILCCNLFRDQSVQGPGPAA